MNLAPIAAFAFSLLALAGPVMGADEVPRVQSPVNQIFQFMHTASTNWPDGSTSKATGYLWVPEKCQKLRGLLILCPNVPEHMLVGHPAIRAACEANDLGIVWSAPSFMSFRKDMPKEHATIKAFLQQLLDGLAATSGYDEVKTVPWLPLGESGHLLMVDALVEAAPERCIAGVWIKNHHLPPKNRTVPALVIFGSAQEWSQDKSDVRTKWNDVGKNYQGILNERTRNPGWPLSYVIDGTSGHFDCSERLTQYIAAYIADVAAVRLPAGDGGALKPVAPADGYVAGLSVPGYAAKDVTALRDAPDEARQQPWYPSQRTADAARAIADINWQAQTQLPAFTDAEGAPLPFDFNGINNIKSVKWDDDGVTFRVGATLLDRIPTTFAVGAGEALAKAPGTPTIEWLCGPIAPAGEGRFRIALDRTYGVSATYLAARHPGSAIIRGVVQPCGVQINALKNSGAPQKISFTPIADVAAGTASVPLVATSDAGLPVEFFVVAGPAVIRNGQLVFTPIPLRAKLPLTVTVAAWQWGRPTEPRINTADVVRQEFRIVAPR